MTATAVVGNLRLGGEVVELAGNEWTVRVGAFSVRTRVVILEEEWVL